MIKTFFKCLLVLVSITSLFISNSYSAGDKEQIDKLSNFKKTGLDIKGEVIPQNTKFAENIKKIFFQKLKCHQGLKFLYLP